jgi:hypothetical protein
MAGEKCWSRRSPATSATVKRLYFRGDAAFANPEINEFLEAEKMEGRGSDTTDGGGGGVL